MVEPSTASNVEPSSEFRHTCVTCRVMFACPDLHRDHFKGDWHRYNLKRKIVELAPVTAETFRLKVTEMSQLDSQSEENAASRRCNTCNKSYQTDAAFLNHCKSKKHGELLDRRLMEPQISDAAAVSETLSTNVSTSVSEISEDFEILDATDTASTVCGEALEINVCLFCSKCSQNLDENLKHMSLRHGFFVVDADYCVDIEGLMTYLGQKVGEGMVCLWCNEKGRRFRSLDAVQKHMVDKCHCKINHDGDSMLEFSEFYDYSSSYPDVESGEKMEFDAEVNIPALVERGYELVLPSGSTVGHRSLNRYYKQNLRCATSQVSLAKKQAISRLVNEYRAIGWTGTTGEVARRKARDLNFMRKIYSKQHMQVGVKANKLQKHFKSQIDF